MTGRSSRKPSQLMSPPAVSTTVNGVPCAIFTMAETCHPPRTSPTRSVRLRRIGSFQVPLNVNRCGVWNRDSPRAKRSSGPRMLVSPAPRAVASDVLSMALLQV